MKEIPGCKIEEVVIPPNALKKRIYLYNQAHQLNLKEFSKKVNIPYRTLTRMTTNNLVSQDPKYYLQLEQTLNCDYIDLYFMNSKELFNYEIRVFELISMLINRVQYEINHEYVSKHDFFSYVYNTYSPILNSILDLLECCWNNMRINAVSSKLNVINSKLQALIVSAKLGKDGSKQYRVDLLSEYFSLVISSQIEWFKNNCTSQVFLSEKSCYLRDKNYLCDKEFLISSTSSLINVFGQLVIRDITFWFAIFDN